MFDIAFPARLAYTQVSGPRFFARISHMKTLYALLALLAFTGWQATPQTVSHQTDGPIVVQNMYWAKPGLETQVYQWRLHASEVRARLGLPRGRVLFRQEASDTLPDVIWECSYPSMEARGKDVAVTSQSPEFHQVEQHMDTLIRKFDRLVVAER
jgi:hypothetical protein